MPSIAHIAHILGVEAWGDTTLEVQALAEPKAASASDLALAMSSHYEQDLTQNTAVKAAILWDGADPASMGLNAAITVSRSRLALAKLTLSFKGQRRDPHRHALTDIAPSSTIAGDASIGAFTCIENDVTIGSLTQIASHVHIAQNAQIGAHCMIGAGVRIGEHVILGDHCIIHPNTVIGCDGFSFVTKTPSHPETGMRTLGRTPFEPFDGTWHKIHSLGGVQIGDHVEIGSCTVIDAGTIRPTSIGNGTKLDNMVQVGHNARIGQDCLLCGHSGVAGSSTLGDRVVLAGQAGVADHVTVGSDVVIAGSAVVLKDVPNGSFMSGHPAQPMPEYRKREKALRNHLKGH